MTFKERIQQGLDGKYSGLNNGFTKLNNYIFGTQRGTKVLIGGDSGTGKTTLVDFILLNTIEDAEAKGIELNIFYNSWEIKELDKKCNWCSQIIYNKYGITIPPEVIKGLGKNRMTKDEQELVFSEMGYIDKLFSKIHFNWTPINPTGLYMEYWKSASEKGKFTYKEYIDPEGKTKNKIDKFIPNNPDAYNIVVLDHLYYLKKEREFGTKEVIDKWSEYTVELSNMFNYSFFNISQFNDGLSAIDRQKFKGADITPQKTDFKDTRNPFSDSDIVIGLMNPRKMDMTECLRYNVNQFGKNFVMLKLIKNRLSEDNIAMGLYFNPKSGTFKELLKPEEITKEYINSLN